MWNVQREEVMMAIGKNSFETGLGRIMDDKLINGY